MEIFRMFVPTCDGSIGIGDLFMVINPKFPEYGAVFECSNLDLEGRVCKWNEDKGFSYLNIEKVALYECTSKVDPGDKVFVSYNVRFPGMISRQFYEGVVVRSLDKKRWHIVNNSGVKVIAPKANTYKKIAELDNKIARYGNGRSFSRRLRESAPS